MATVSKGLSFGAAETLTNTKLHNLVDLATVTDITNSDIAAGAMIDDSKLDDILVGNKVGGTALFGLASIPSGSGRIPPANTSLELGASLVSIPNTALLPLSLPSHVDGYSIYGLASVPSSVGQLPYQSLVSSMASGALAVQNGANNFIGKNLAEIQDPTALTLLSITTMSADSTSDNVTIEPNKLYEVLVLFNQNTSSGQVDIRFEDDASTNYEDMGQSNDGLPAEGAAEGSESATGITATGTIAANNKGWIKFEIDTHKVNTDSAFVMGHGISKGTNRYEKYHFGGAYVVDVTISSFELADSGGTMTGNIYLYEKALALS